MCSDCDVGALSCDENLVSEYSRSVCRRKDGGDDGRGEGRPSIDLYPLELAESGTLTIDLVGDFDTLLQLYTDDCVLVGHDDDGGEAVNARLVVEVAGGRYRVGVSSYEEGALALENIRARVTPGERRGAPEDQTRSMKTVIDPLAARLTRRFDAHAKAVGNASSTRHPNAHPRER